MAGLYSFGGMQSPAESYPIGSPGWVKGMSARLQHLVVLQVKEHNAPYICRIVKQLLGCRPPPWSVFPEDRPFGTPDDYCLAVTGHTWEQVMALLEVFAPKAEYGRVKRTAEKALAVAQIECRGAGRPGKDDLSTEMPYVVRNLSEKGRDGGNSSEYLRRRLARDYPKILDRYEAGEIPTIRAAAREAGIVKTPTPFELVKKLVPKLSPAEKRQLRKLLED